MTERCAEAMVTGSIAAGEGVEPTDRTELRDLPGGNRLAHE